MRILLVAPDTDPYLPGLADEVSAVVGSHQVELLNGVVLERELLAAVDKGPFDVVWFATHSTQEGLHLGGTVLNIGALVPIINASGAELVYFNSCASVIFANAVAEEALVDVIATIVDAPDDVATRTATLFARKLASSCDFRQAYEESKPGQNRLYLYIDGNGRRTMANTPNTIQIDGRQLELLGAQIERLTVQVTGMSTDIAVLKTEMAGIKDSLSEAGRRRDTLVWLAVVLSFVSFVIGVALLAMHWST